MKNWLTATGAALMLSISSVANASDFQTRFGSDFEPDAQGWGGLEYDKYTVRGNGWKISVPSYRLSAGADIPVIETDNGTWFGGFFLGYATERGEGTRPTDNGVVPFKTDWSKGYLGGLSATYIADSGIYFDSSVRFENRSHDILTETRLKGDAYGFDLEMGRKFPLGDNWAVTPSVGWNSTWYSGSVTGVDICNGGNCDPLAKIPGFTYHDDTTSNNDTISFADRLQTPRFGAVAERKTSWGRVYGELDFSQVRYGSKNTPWGASVELGTDVSAGNGWTLSLDISATDRASRDEFGKNLQYGGGIALKRTF